jgi:hypothetical protein
MSKQQLKNAQRAIRNLTPAAQRRAGRQHADNAPGIVVTGGGKASARTVADNFLRSNAAAWFD